MAHRTDIYHRRTDRQYFKNTANSTKKINVMPKVSRGGIRL